MLLELLRYSSSTATLGLFFIRVAEGARDERRFVCYTLEDQHRPAKIPGQTRIPAGVYDIDFHFGGHFQRYRQRYPKVHPTNAHGMLHLAHVPGYENILIHIGNFIRDTEGCILVGTQPTVDNNGLPYIIGSTEAYALLYSQVSSVLLSGDVVRISIVDYDSTEPR